ncbi:MAG: hypothetical protein H0V23_14090 [Nocardioidaceae bacterium]|nr:hypothetical protein [Nocardioidaceae bacterium]
MSADLKLDQTPVGVVPELDELLDLFLPGLGHGSAAVTPALTNLLYSSAASASA